MSNRFSLDHLGSFSIEGPDALEYAQSQFTVGVETLSDEYWSPLAWCDPKGRVIAFMMALASEEGVDLVLPASQAEEVRERLQRFTIGRKAKVAEVGGVAGTFDRDAGTAALSFDPDRGMLSGTRAGSDPKALRRWKRLDICRGLPWLEPASSEQHLPQWLGLEELGALAYDKGCYPGQEVIARLHYRGSVKYRLAGLALDAAASPDAHTRIVDRDGAVVGHWLRGMKVNEGTIGLVVLSTRIENGDIVQVSDKNHPQQARVTAPEGLC